MKTHKNHLRLLILLLLVLLACVGYMTVGVHFENQKLFAYAMRIRTPKLIAMLITAFAIGSASIVFQSIINNTIVTPCLLGMDQLYSLIHTAVFFVAGSGSFLAVNANAAFAVDLAIMGAVATVIYSYLFQKTNHNVLYVLLIGTVLTSFFSSIQTTLTRVMDPQRVRHAADGSGRQLFQCQFGDSGTVRCGSCAGRLCLPERTCAAGRSDTGQRSGHQSGCGL